MNSGPRSRISGCTRRAGVRIGAQAEQLLDLPEVALEAADQAGDHRVGLAASTISAPITVVRVRTISRAASGVTPRRPMRRAVVRA